MHIYLLIKKLISNHFSHSLIYSDGLLCFSTCLLNKVDDITTLCDIQACAIIYTLDKPKPKEDKDNVFHETLLK